jgi:hypothetical protein
MAIGLQRLILTRSGRESKVTGCELNVLGSSSAKGSDFSLFTASRTGQQSTQSQKGRPDKKYQDT